MSWLLDALPEFRRNVLELKDGNVTVSRDSARSIIPGRHACGGDESLKVENGDQHKEILQPDHRKHLSDVVGLD